MVAAVICFHANKERAVIPNLRLEAFRLLVINEKLNAYEQELLLTGMKHHPELRPREVFEYLKSIATIQGK